MKPITLLVNLLSGKKGKLITLVTSLVTGIITKLAVAKNFTWLDANTINSLATAAGAGVGFMVEWIVGYVNINNIQSLQDILKGVDPSLKSDGHPGQKTQDAATAAVAAAVTNPNPPVEIPVPTTPAE